MRNMFEEAGSPTSPKAKWAKPVVRQLTAGAAEANAGGADDGDPGGALDNS